MSVNTAKTVFAVVSIFLFLLTCAKQNTLYDPSGAEPARCFALLCDTLIENPTLADTVHLVRCDTIHTGDSIAFIGIVTPVNANLKSIKWDFGDGKDTSVDIVSHRYARGGKYYGVFTIEDKVGLKFSDTVVVCVNTPPVIGNLVSPANGEKTVDPKDRRGIRFQWTATDADGDSLKARLYISTDSVFLQPSAIDIDTDFYDYVGNLETLKKYFWRIVVEDKYKEPDTSKTFSFSTKDPDASGGILRGYAFYQGWKKHGGIKIRASAPQALDRIAVTNDSGFYQISNVDPRPNYTIIATDTAKGQFNSDSTHDTITMGVITIADTLRLKDPFKPVISNNLPVSAQSIRRPAITANFSDRGSGILLSSAHILFNDSNITAAAIVSDSGWHWMPPARLPDATYKITASVKDSAGNVSDTMKWTFTVDAMKLTILTLEDTIVRINDTVHIYSIVHDVYSKVAQYKWDFDGNGTWDDSAKVSDTVISRPHVYKHDTTYNAIVYCRDDSGMVKLDTVTIIVGNAAPKILTIRPNDTISIRDSVQFFATATDVDGTIKEYAWDFNGDGVFEFTSATNASAAFRYDTARVYKAVLRVTDDDNKATKDTVTITVDQDIPRPEADRDTTVSIKDTVHLHGSATQRFGAIVEWAWDVGNSGTFRITSKGDTTIIAPGAEDTNYLCVLRVTDDDGNVAKDTVKIKVLQDIPVANAGNDSLAGINVSIPFKGTAVQQFGRIVMYKWDFDGNGTWDDSSTITGIAVHTYTYDTTYNAKLLVRDDDGNEATAIRHVTIRHSPPMITAIRPNATISIKDSILFFATSIHDVNAPVKEYAWDFKHDGTFEYVSGASANAGYRYNTTGIYIAILRVTDDGNASAYDSTIVTVVQDTPQITYISRDTVVDYGGTVRCSVYVQQQFGTMTVEVDTANNGNFKVVGNLGLSGGEKCSFTTGTECSWDSVKFRVTDDDGNVVKRGFRVRVKPRPLAITSIDSTVNSITVHFTPTQETDFAAYLIYKNSSSTMDTTDTLWTAVTDAGTLQWTRSTNTRGPGYFRIYQRDAEGVLSSGSTVIYGNIVNSPPTTPSIVFPAHDGDSLWPNQPIRWSKCTDPNGQTVKYKVLVNHNNYGYVQFATEVTDTFVQLQNYDLLAMKLKVIAYDSEGDSSGWSGARGCYVKGIFPLSTSVFAIAIDDQGNKWFGTNGAINVWKFDDLTWTNYATAFVQADNSVRAIAIDGQGNKWFGGGGVSKFDGTTWTTYTVADGLAGNSVKAIAIDKQGDKWVGTDGGVSMLMFNGVNWTTYFTTANGLASNDVNTIFIDTSLQNTFWIGTYLGVSKSGPPNSLTTYTTANGLAGDDVTCVAIDGQDNKWFGTYFDGASEFDGVNWTTYNTPNSKVTSMAIDDQGNKWFGTTGGVSRFDGTTWTTYTSANGLAGDQVNAIAIDSQGNKWFGTNNGVSKFDGTTWTTYR